MQGARGRETGAYKVVREDFEPPSNEAVGPTADFQSERAMISFMISLVPP
jgi:hypothetical protein